MSKNTKNIIITNNACKGYWEILEQNGEEDKNFYLRPQFNKPKISHVKTKSLKLLLPFEIVFGIFDRSYMDNMTAGDYKSMVSLVFSSRTFLIRFYSKFIGGDLPIYSDNLIGRVSGLFKCLYQSINLLNQPAIPANETAPMQHYVVEIPGLSVIPQKGCTPTHDWCNSISWPWCAPHMAIRPLEHVFKIGGVMCEDLKNCVDGFDHLNTSWISGKCTDSLVLQVDYFKSPVVCFNCVDIVNGQNLTNLYYADGGQVKSESISVWVKFLKLYLGPECGVFNSRVFDTGMVTVHLTSEVY